VQIKAEALKRFGVAKYIVGWPCCIKGCKAIIHVPEELKRGNGRCFPCSGGLVCQRCRVDVYPIDSLEPKFSGVCHKCNSKEHLKASATKV